MINILSINCSLAFAPYLIDAMAAVEAGSLSPSRPIRQGGSGLILSPDAMLGPDTLLALIHRNRRADLGPTEASHYQATIGLRAKAYDIKLISEEVVLASVNGELLISHPQSEIWLEMQAARQMAHAYRAGEVQSSSGSPDWLTASVAAGRLLLSDHRTGRWVLLGADHIADIERRLTVPELSSKQVIPAPPVIPVKGVAVHLQSAFKLARTLTVFAQTRQVQAYEEAAPNFKLGVGPSIEGIQIYDTNARAGLTPREAGKWANVIDAELKRLNAAEAVRGRITTIFADAPGGRFVLQWGDEVLVPDTFSARENEGDDRSAHSEGSLIWAIRGGFTIFLDLATSSCVGLRPDELSML